MFRRHSSGPPDDSDGVSDRIADVIGPSRPRPPAIPRQVMRHVQSRLVAGVLVFLPVLVTYLILSFFYDIVSSLLDPFIAALNIPHGPGFDWSDVLEVIVIAIVIYIAGLLIGWAVTKLIINRVHDIIANIPVIGPVYNTTRVGIDFLSDTQHHQYRGVVLIEFPRIGVFSIGLITSNIGPINEVEDFLTVYVPTTPVPSSGYLVVIPERMVTPTDISVDEAMRMIISGGILAGEVFAQRAVLKRPACSGQNWLWGGGPDDSRPDDAPSDDAPPDDAPPDDAPPDESVIDVAVAAGRAKVKN